MFGVGFVWLEFIFVLDVVLVCVWLLVVCFCFVVFGRLFVLVLLCLLLGWFDCCVC